MDNKRKGKKTIATQIAPTPVIKGRLAKTILKEIKRTPSSKAAEGAKKIIALFEKH